MFTRYNMYKYENKYNEIQFNEMWILHNQSIFIQSVIL